MHKRPKEQDLLKPRTWKNKQWWYWHEDTGGKFRGEFRIHKPSECEERAFKRITDKSGKKSSKGKSDKKLKLSKALSSVIEKNEEESDSSGYE